MTTTTAPRHSGVLYMPHTTEDLSKVNVFMIGELSFGYEWNAARAEV
jgi:hypothetical protein